MKRKVLNETKLHNIVCESVRKVLKENINDNSKIDVIEQNYQECNNKVQQVLRYIPLCRTKIYEAINMIYDEFASIGGQVEMEDSYHDEEKIYLEMVINGLGLEDEEKVLQISETIYKKLVVISDEIANTIHYSLFEISYTTDELPMSFIVEIPRMEVILTDLGGKI